MKNEKLFHEIRDAIIDELVEDYGNQIKMNDVDEAVEKVMFEIKVQMSELIKNI